MAKRTDLLAARSKKLGAGRLPVTQTGADSIEGASSTPVRAAGSNRRVTTVSLYESDRTRIRAIRRALEDLDEVKGGHLDASKIIRLALRAVEVNGPELLDALRNLHADDGRRQRKKGF